MTIKFIDYFVQTRMIYLPAFLCSKALSSVQSCLTGRGVRQACSGADVYVTRMPSHASIGARVISQPQYGAYRVCFRPAISRCRLSYMSSTMR